METIRLINLSIGYLHKKKIAKTVATDINASICSGELTCLLGTNGIGKSTLLRTLSAFQPPLSGRILIEGRDITAYQQKELAKEISVVLTGKPDVNNITVGELVGLGRSPYTGFWGSLTEDDKDVVETALMTIGIQSLKERNIQTLSDGERQKAMVAKALAQQTPVILLDEPTAFLDFPSKVEMMLLLHRLAHESGKTIFLSTHDIEIAVQIADKLWLMGKQGSLSINTPHLLAQQGVLGEFIAGEHLQFDPESMMISIIR